MRAGRSFGRSEEGQNAPAGQSNWCNGATRKALKGEGGELPVSIPCDRESSFEPELLKKGQTSIDEMDEKILGLTPAGLTVRDIQAHPLELMG